MRHEVPQLLGAQTLPLSPKLSRAVPSVCVCERDLEPTSARGGSSSRSPDSSVGRASDFFNLRVQGSSPCSGDCFRTRQHALLPECKKNWGFGDAVIVHMPGCSTLCPCRQASLISLFAPVASPRRKLHDSRRCFFSRRNPSLFINGLELTGQALRFYSVCRQ